jgi:cyclophilin family peptidyl-prolyl cis-trans isomerase
MINRQATDGDPTTKGNPFVIQGGGFNANVTTNDLGVVTTTTPTKGEPHTSNTRGTIAFALPSDQNNVPLKDQGTDQWFFNETANTFLDPYFTVFGTIKNASGLAVMDAIGALTRKDLSNATSHDPQGVTVGGNFGFTPVVNANATPSTLSPLTDLVIVRRIAVLNKVVAFPT